MMLFYRGIWVMKERAWVSMVVPRVRSDQLTSRRLKELVLKTMLCPRWRTEKGLHNGELDLLHTIIG